jgi:hypothetical protein
MPLTYPPPAPTVSGDSITIHTLLQSPTLIQRRMRTLAEQRFISDALLTGRYTSSGGAVKYEIDDELTPPRDPEAIQPGGEYPLSPVGTGDPQLAEVVKWGQDVPITDESIKRSSMDVVNRAFLKVIAGIVKKVDTVSLAAIASRVSQNTAAAAHWDGTATAEQIFLDVGLAAANMQNLGLGLNPDIVAVDPIRWVYAMTAFVKAGYVPRETAASNPALTGEFPTIGGRRWVSSPYVPDTAVAWVIDSTSLGGMADEQLGGPGYTGAMAGVESKSIRDDDNDRYKLRGRRVTVPVVIEARAGWKITGLHA